MKELNLSNFTVYQRSRELSRIAWEIYQGLPKEFKYGMGMQWQKPTFESLKKSAL